MDDTKTLNPSLGGSPGDLWKKVLDEVQTDAAARRSKAAARATIGDKRGAVEVDLLKRILVAIETRRESDEHAKKLEQQAQRLEQILAAVQSVPRTDTATQFAALQQQVGELSQRLADLAGRRDDKADPALLDALQKVRAEIQGIPQALPQPADTSPRLDEIAQAIGASTTSAQESQQALLAQIAQHLSAIPKPADLSPQFRALEAAIAASSTASNEAILKQIAAAKHEPDPGVAAALSAIAQRVETLPASLLAGLPQPATGPDHTAELRSILDAVRSMPTVDPDGLANRIVEAIERIKPVDPSDLLHQVRADIAALPKPADPAAKLDALLAAAQVATTATQIEQLRAEIQALPKPVDASAKLDGLLAWMQTSATAVEVQQLRSEIAALPRPVDSTARLEAIFAAIETSPVGSQIEQLRAQVQALPEQLGQGAKLDAILAALPSMQTGPLAEQVQQLRTEIGALPKPADATEKLDAILAAVHAAPPLDTASLLAQLRTEIQAIPKPADATEKLDAILAAVHAAPPLDTASLLAQLRAEIQAIPKPADATEKLDAILSAVHAAPSLDAATLLAQLRAEIQAIPRTADGTEKLDAILAAVQAAPTLDVASLVTQFRAEVAAIPKPVDPSAKIDELIAAWRKPVNDGRDEVLLQILESVQKPQPAYHERFDQIIARLSTPAAAVAPVVAPELVEKMSAALAKLPDASSIGEQVRGALAALPRPADVTPQIGSILGAITALGTRPAADVEGAVQRAVGEALKGQADLLQQVRSEFAGMREALRQDVAAQTAGLRDDLLTRSNDVITQVRMQSQTLREDVTRSTSRLRDEIQTVGPAAQAATSAANDDALKSVVAKLRGNPVLVKQDELLRRLGAASRINPAHQPDLVRKMLGELPRLAEWDPGTMPLVEQLIESFGPDEMSDDAPAPGTPGYSWMTQSPRKGKAMPIAIGIAAFITICVIVFLVINALSGPPANANGSAAAPGNRTNAGDGGKTDGTVKPGGTDPAKALTAVTPAPVAPAVPPTPAKDAAGTADAKAPFELFPKASDKGPQTPTAPVAIVSELRNLAEGGVDKTRIHDIPHARQIVFLVHSATTSPTALASILAELKKSMAKVGPQQKFTIIFSEGTRFIEAPPHGLRDGGDKEKAAMESWIATNIRPAERATTNPLMAMDVAISYAPDLLWIVSDGLAGDGPGQAPSKEIIDRIATLNPQGQTRIAATQVGPADAAGTLKAITQAYGGVYAETGGGPAVSNK